MLCRQSTLIAISSRLVVTAAETLPVPLSELAERLLSKAFKRSLRVRIYMVTVISSIVRILLESALQDSG
jgi:hypothetical protein